MSKKKKNGMSREEAAKLYETLKTQMESKYGKKGLAQLIDEERGKGPAGGLATLGAALGGGKAGGVVPPEPGAKPGSAPKQSPRASSLAQATSSVRRQLPSGSGFNGALVLIVGTALLKLGFTVMEATGVLGVPTASATMAQLPPIASVQRPQFSREEMRILTQLDSRRSELEDREKKLDGRASDLDMKDREFAARLTQLRELTQKLKGDRVKNDRKRQAQLDQLANVYGSMNPKESAELIEQLDVTIALQLIERMPEKRIGQILSMMSPDRALAITRMLSGKS